MRHWIEKAMPSHCFLPVVFFGAIDLAELGGIGDKSEIVPLLHGQRVHPSIEHVFTQEREEGAREKVEYRLEKRVLQHGFKRL